MAPLKPLTTFAGGLKHVRDSIGADYDADATSDVLAVRASKAKKQRLAACRGSSDLDSAQTLPPKVAPYFFYTDHSRDADHDPLSPVTQSGTVPSFPIKMHALLSKLELRDILSWDSHGRSFRILKPRQFESDILPRYFDHSKFSSFTRQLNGWGFRRLTEGENMGSYYEEHFLRSMPWLCKKMKRPKVGEKQSICAQHEPDLAAISKEFPVPNHAMTREIRVVLETMAKGPKAKVPEHWLFDGEELNPNLDVPIQIRFPNLHGNKNDDTKLVAQLRHHDPSVKSLACSTAGVATPPMPTGEVNALHNIPRFLKQSGNVGAMTNLPITRQVSVPDAVPLTQMSTQNLLESLHQQISIVEFVKGIQNTRQVSLPAAAPSHLAPIRSDCMLAPTMSNKYQVSVPPATQDPISTQGAALLTALLQRHQHRGNVGSVTDMPSACQVSVLAAAAAWPQAPIQNDVKLNDLLQSLQCGSNFGSMTVTPSMHQRNVAHNAGFSATATKLHAMASPHLLTTLLQNLKHNDQVQSMTGSTYWLTNPTETTQWGNITMPSKQDHPLRISAEQYKVLRQGITNNHNSLKESKHSPVASDRC